MKIINLLYCFSIFAMSCQPIQSEDSISEMDCNCTDLPIIDGPSFGYQFITNDSANYTRPFPNPNNADEFLFIQRIKRFDALYTYNLKTKQKIKLLEGRILFVPKWGKNDWILVTREDEQIWKLKSNGDSLQQLSQIAPNYVPEWDYKSEKIIFYKNSDNPILWIKRVFYWIVFHSMQVQGAIGIIQMDFSFGKVSLQMAIFL